jgi:hypothetical protein
MPAIPNSRPNSCIQCGIRPEETAMIIVISSIWPSIIARIGPIGFPVAIEKLANVQPARSKTLPARPKYHKSHSIYTDWKWTNEPMNITDFDTRK